MSDAGAGRPGARRELVAPPSAPRLDLFIAGALDLSRTQAATLIATGQVRVEGRVERASYRPTAGNVSSWRSPLGQPGRWKPSPFR